MVASDHMNLEVGNEVCPETLDWTEIDSDERGGERGRFGFEACDCGASDAEECLVPLRLEAGRSGIVDEALDPATLGVGPATGAGATEKAPLGLDRRCGAREDVRVGSDRGEFGPIRDARHRVEHHETHLHPSGVEKACHLERDRRARGVPEEDTGFPRVERPLDHGTHVLGGRLDRSIDGSRSVHAPWADHDDGPVLAERLCQRSVDRGGASGSGHGEDRWEVAAPVEHDCRRIGPRVIACSTAPSQHPPHLFSGREPLELRSVEGAVLAIREHVEEFDRRQRVEPRSPEVVIDLQVVHAQHGSGTFEREAIGGVQEGFTPPFLHGSDLGQCRELHEAVLVELAVGGRGQVINGDETSRHHERRQRPSQFGEGDVCVQPCLVGDHESEESDGRPGALCDDRCGPDAGMGLDGLLDLARFDAIAVDLDLAVDPAELTPIARAAVARAAEEAHLREELIGALERSNADLDGFAYVASHDLKAPLRGIASLADWIGEDLGEQIPDSVRGHLAMLRGRVHRLEDLIEGILRYSRAGRTGREVTAVDVGALLAETIELLAPPATATVVVEAGMPVFATARAPLQQVFMNLIGNALKHAAGPATAVRVGVRDAGAAWEFSVTDNGAGIAPIFHEQIWGIFQRLKSRDEVEGAGIGLSVVRKTVSAFGGRAWVESAADAGACFRFTWPKA